MAESSGTPGIKISELPSISSLNESYNMVVDDGSNTRKATIASFRRFFTNAAASEASDIKALQKDMRNVKLSVDTIQRSLTAFVPTDTSELERRVGQNERNILSASEAINDLLGRVSILENNLNDLTERVDDLDGKDSKKKPSPVKWYQCKKSSNWIDGAETRLMDILNPAVVSSDFDLSVQWMKNTRECDCANLILANEDDGTLSGYSPYGDVLSDFIVDDLSVDLMSERIKTVYNSGLGVVLWLMTDSDGGAHSWNTALISNFRKYVADIASFGWLDYASTVVLGLELNEYATSAQTSSLINVLRQYYDGKIGVHFGNVSLAIISSYAKEADLVFLQNQSLSSEEEVSEYVAGALAALNKPVSMFELSGDPNRDFDDAALQAGAFNVGNY